MKVWSDSIKHGEPIPTQNAFGKHDPEQHMTLADNYSPHIAWSELPEGTKSLVLLCHDADAPSSAEDVNQESKTVPASLSRVDFYHWVLIDIPADGSPLKEGEFSDQVTLKGKEGPLAPRGLRRGINNYTDFLAGNPDMAGTYWGYDGPCPPWNDELIHRYYFTLYALDIEKCPVEGQFRGEDVLKAIEGRTLDKAQFMGTYTINPDAKMPQ
jgi:hypothetical protein